MTNETNIDAHWMTAESVLRFMLDVRGLDYNNTFERGLLLDEIRTDVKTASEYARLASAGLRVATVIERDINDARSTAS